MGWSVDLSVYWLVMSLSPTFGATACKVLSVDRLSLFMRTSHISLIYFAALGGLRREGWRL